MFNYRVLGCKKKRKKKSFWFEACYCNVGIMKLIWEQERLLIGSLQAFKHFGPACRQGHIMKWNFKSQREPSDLYIWYMVLRFLLGILQQLIHHTVSFSMYGRSLEFYLRGNRLLKFSLCLHLVVYSVTTISLV